MPNVTMLRHLPPASRPLPAVVAESGEVSERLIKNGPTPNVPLQ
jgi:hypothetical protein